MQEKILHFGSLTIGLKLKINRVAFRSYAFADCGDGQMTRVVFIFFKVGEIVESRY